MQAVDTAVWCDRQKARTETLASNGGNVVYFRYTTPNAAAKATVNRAEPGFFRSIQTAAAGIRSSRPVGLKAIWVRLMPDSRASGRMAVTVGRAISNNAHDASPTVFERVDSQAAASRIANPGNNGSR